MVICLLLGRQRKPELGASMEKTRQGLAHDPGKSMRPIPKLAPHPSWGRNVFMSTASETDVQGPREAEDMDILRSRGGSKKSTSTASWRPGASVLQAEDT
eukprot:8701680-Pyramimonas_sp.AAC.1